MSAQRALEAWRFGNGGGGENRARSDRSPSFYHPRSSLGGWAERAQLFKTVTARARLFGFRR